MNKAGSALSPDAMDAEEKPITNVAAQKTAQNLDNITNSLN